METALVSVLLITIIYGVVETSFLIRDGIVVSSAARAGARQASSLPRDSGFADLTRKQAQDALGEIARRPSTQVWVYRSNTSDTARPPASCPATTCMRWTGGSAGLGSQSGTWNPTSQNACGINADTLSVTVSATYKSRIGWLFDGRTQSDTTTMRLEPYPGAVCKP